MKVTNRISRSNWIGFVVLSLFYCFLMTFLFERKVIAFTMVNVLITFASSFLWSLITLTAYLATQQILGRFLGGFGQVIAVLLFPLHVYLGIFYFPFWLIRLFRSDLKIFLKSTALLGSVLFILFDSFILSVAFSNYLSKAGSHSATGHIKIPLEYTNSGHIRIWCSINGKEYPFILDTGAGNILFKNKVEELTNWSSLRWFSPGISASGSIFFNTISKTGSFEIGKFQFHDYYVDVIDYNPGYCDSDIVGIIGKDLMRNFYWEINNTNHELIISVDGSGLTPFSQADTIKLDKNRFSDHLRLHLTVNDTLKRRFVFDTGFNGSLSMGIDPNSISNANTRKIIGTGAIDLAGKSQNLSYYKVNTVSASPNRMILATQLDAAIAPKRRNLIGIGALKNRDFIIDYFGSKLLLETSNMESIAVNKRMFGLVLKVSDGLVKVKSVLENSTADSLGITPEMEIIKINGIPITHENYCEIKGMTYKEEEVTIDFVERVNGIKLKKKELFYFHDLESGAN